MASVIGSIFGVNSASVNLITSTFLDAQSNPIRETHLPSQQANIIVQADPLSTNGAARAISNKAAEAVSDVLTRGAQQSSGLLIDKIL